MVEALNLKTMMDTISNRYEYDEHRVVGIILARYGTKPAQEMVAQCFQYWNLNTHKVLDVFWPGYGKYLSPYDESDTKQILSFKGNHNRIYFDLEAFIDVKDEMFEHCGIAYEDKLQLILVNYRNGKLFFNESIKIDLEDNFDENCSKIRSIMEFITRECRRVHEVAPIARKLKTDHIREIIKGITISDIVGTAIGIAGLGIPQG